MEFAEAKCYNHVQRCLVKVDLPVNWFQFYGASSVVENRRWTSVDPLTASATIRNPQTFNRYAYAHNSPYKFTDPLGLIPSSTGACGAWCPGGDSGSFGSRSGYQDVSANFLAEPETITVNLNIVYDASQFNAQQAVEALKPQIQDLA
ncbi:hypothetical protein JGC48_24030, partial [Salmonella enterica subsp. enterica serovar Derby]|nr:hypothetical protein [Salmonella enterica subsp. enterica serovar Derby]